MNLDNRIDKIDALHQRLSEDWKVFLSEGEVASYSGSFFTWNMEGVMSVAAGIHFRFTLKEKVDVERLERAVEEAVRICPYIAFGLCFHERMPRLSYKRLDGKIPVFRGYLPQRFDEKSLEGHFAFASYEGNKLVLCICHAITDGNGFMKFIHALFESYYDGQVKAYEIDGADVMKYEWPLTAGYKPILEGTDKVFTLPESKTGTDIFTSHFFITRRSFDLCRSPRFC